MLLLCGNKAFRAYSRGGDNLSNNSTRKRPLPSPDTQSLIALSQLNSSSSSSFPFFFFFLSFFLSLFYLFRPLLSSSSSANFISSFSISERGAASQHLIPESSSSSHNTWLASSSSTYPIPSREANWMSCSLACGYRSLDMLMLLLLLLLAAVGRCFLAPLDLDKHSAALLLLLAPSRSAAGGSWAHPWVNETSGEVSKALLSLPFLTFYSGSAAAAACTSCSFEIQNDTFLFSFQQQQQQRKAPDSWCRPAYTCIT